MQEDDPYVDAYEPMGQGVKSVALVAPEAKYVPGGATSIGVHVAGEVAPNADENVAGGQRVQSVRVEDEKVPGTHLTHVALLVALVTDEKVPASQSVHALEPLEPVT